MNAVATAAPHSASHSATVGETIGLLISAAATPLLVHLLPSWDTLPLGAHLLPMFWVAFIAAHLFGAKVGVITCLAGPLASLALSGAPALGRLGMMTVELLIFVGCVSLATRRWPRLWLVAPLSYATAKLALALGLLIVGSGAGTPFAAMANALAGLGILTLINAALVVHAPEK